jgi:hypothetical protein
MALFIFDFRDDEKQTRRSLLSSLLVQLCNQSDNCYDVLFRFYSNTALARDIQVIVNSHNVRRCSIPNETAPSTS